MGSWKVSESTSASDCELGWDCDGFGVSMEEEEVSGFTFGGVLALAGEEGLWGRGEGEAVGVCFLFLFFFGWNNKAIDGSRGAMVDRWLMMVVEQRV